MLEVRTLEEGHIPLIVAAFAQIGWHKPRSLFMEYLAEQVRNERFVWVVMEQELFVGYVTLKLHSLYEPFKTLRIPEIADLNVLPYHRKRGAGSLLLETAETKAKEFSAIVGIGVGLYADYGSAQRLYVNRHYIPDGKGLTYQYKKVVAGHTYPVDDDLVLWFTKKLP
ncbi:MAG: GNAT family N-acetyltransferase [Candidatus Berkiella sp.]